MGKNLIALTYMLANWMMARSQGITAEEWTVGTGKYRQIMKPRKKARLPQLQRKNAKE